VAAHWRVIGLRELFISDILKERLLLWLLFPGRSF